MLKEIVSITLSHNTEIKEGTLFVYNITVNESIKQCIQYLETRNIIENSIHQYMLGAKIDLELTLAHLHSIGYYENVDALIAKNRYTYPLLPVYVKDLNAFSDENNCDFFSQYKAVITFIDAIKQIAKHTFRDIEIDIAVIFLEDKSVILSLDYSTNDILSLSPKALLSIASVADTFADTNSEKKLLFINELIDAIASIGQESKFSIILRGIEDFKQRCNNAYQYYLSDFSYNKLKIELDSKALEFTQKIQYVINDSQTKLVAIPTAFVLVFAAFDFTDLYTVKNITSIMSLFIFAVIIQIFLNNQHSTLSFIKTNIEFYKSTFKQSNAEKFSEKFEVVDKELRIQTARLWFVSIILWLIPVVLFTIWVVMLYNQYKVIYNKIILRTLFFYH